MGRILVVAGTRPEFIKLAPLVGNLRARFDVCFLATGQHTDEAMLNVKAWEGFPDFDHILEWPTSKVGDAHAEAAIGISDFIEETRFDPDLVVVQGDTASCLAGALAGERMGVPVAHVEAGLRSWDIYQVEEKIRKLVDHMSALCFCPGEFEAEMLRTEFFRKFGEVKSKIYVTGNTAFDAYERCLDGRSWAVPAWVPGGRWAFATFHRTELLADPALTSRLLTAVAFAVSEADLDLRIPVHPSLLRSVGDPGKWLSDQSFEEPFPYRDVVRVLSSSARKPDVVITDSGGLSEEAAWAGIPTIIVRPSTERWQLLSRGFATLASPEDVVTKPLDLQKLIRKAINPDRPRIDQTPYVCDDGESPTAKIVKHITRFLDA